MKNKLFLISILTFVTVSCGVVNTNRNALGSPYDLMVVATKITQKSVVGDTLRAIFNSPVEWVNRKEPIYSMMMMNPKGLQTTASQYRNLMVVNINPNFNMNEMYADTNRYAQGQLMLTIQSPSIDSAANYIWRHKKTIVGLYNKVEKDRYIARVGKYNQQKIEKLIMDKFGFSVSVPRGYLVEDNKDNYLALQMQTRYGSIGMVFYTFDTKPTGVKWLTDERDIAVANISGPKEGSFMITDVDKERFPATRQVYINDHEWYQTRGYWYIDGDFMGGPFVNYVTFFDGQYIGIDCFVQAPDPKELQRNYIRQFEIVPLTAKFGKKKIENTHIDTNKPIKGIVINN